MPVIHRLAHRCEIFWNASRVQPYSRSRVTVGREGITRVPGGHSLYAETGGQSTTSTTPLCPPAITVDGHKVHPAPAWG